MGTLELIRFLHSSIRHSAISLIDDSMGTVIAVNYDYKGYSTFETMNEFDSDFAAAMLELEGSVQFFNSDVLSVQIPSFSGRIVSLTMVDGSLWKLIEKRRECP
jgi:hypothetical protein